jgi:hypothetical protein
MGLYVESYKDMSNKLLILCRFSAVKKIMKSDGQVDTLLQTCSRQVRLKSINLWT